MMVISLLFPMNVQADQVAAEVAAPHAILMEVSTGTVLMEKAADEKVHPASVTKIMTMLLVMEALEQGKIALNDTVTVSEYAASMGGSQVYLEPYETQTVETLLKCVAVASANDAAVALAEHISGSEGDFVKKMNQKAAELGMKNTHFVNCCGLDDDAHLTTARDVAVMSREILKNHPQIHEYCTIWMENIVHTTARGDFEFGLSNTNKLIKWYEGATGLKTGSTGKALYCLSGTAERNGLHLIGVVMAAPDFKLRFQETMKLLDYGFANYSAEKGLPAGKEMGRIPVTKGMEDSVSAVVQEEISILLKKDIGGEWETKTELLPAMDAPVAAGEKVGELIYLLHGKEVGRTDLITAEAVEKANINTMLQRMLKQWF